MDIASGTFTAQTGGLYTVTFSGAADVYTGSVIVIVNVIVILLEQLMYMQVPVLSCIFFTTGHD